MAAFASYGCNKLFKALFKYLKFDRNRITSIYTKRASQILLIWKQQSLIRYCLYFFNLMLYTKNNHLWSTIEYPRPPFIGVEIGGSLQKIILFFLKIIVNISFISFVFSLKDYLEISNSLKLFRKNHHYFNTKTCIVMFYKIVQ